MRSVSLVLRPLFVATLFVAACDSSTYVDPYPYGGSPSFGGTTATDAGGPIAIPPSACEFVHEGEYCYEAAEQAGCERRTSANIHCNTVIACENYVRVLEVPLNPACATACPSAFTEVAPDACAQAHADTLICEYESGTCGCVPVGSSLDGGVHPDVDADAGTTSEADAGADAGDDAGDDAGEAPHVTYEWRCIKPVTGCPRVRPTEGDTCVRPMTCNYGDCLFPDGVQMKCEGGAWAAYATCPR